MGKRATDDGVAMPNQKITHSTRTFLQSELATGRPFRSSYIHAAYVRWCSIPRKTSKSKNWQQLRQRATHFRFFFSFFWMIYCRLSAPLAWRWQWNPTIQRLRRTHEHKVCWLLMTGRPQTVRNAPINYIIWCNISNECVHAIRIVPIRRSVARKLHMIIARGSAVSHTKRGLAVWIIWLHLSRQGESLRKQEEEEDGENERTIEQGRLHLSQ